MPEPRYHADRLVLDQAWPLESLEIHNRLAPLGDLIMGTYMQDVCEAAPEGGLIVEIGAGNGRLGALVTQQYRPRYIQTEIGEENCVAAQAKSPDLITLVSKAQKLPFADSSIGTIVARNLLDMVDTKAVIHETARVLQPGGLAFHFRDHRPNLTWLQQNYAIDPSKRLVPYFDDQDTVTRYYVVPEEAVEHVTNEDTQALLTTFLDPHYHDVFAKDPRFEEYKKLSHILGSYAEDITAPFNTIMDNKVESLFKEAGMAVTTDYADADADIPLFYAIAKFGWDGSKNHLINNTVLHTPAVTHDRLRIGLQMTVTTASKS